MAGKRQDRRRSKRHRVALRLMFSRGQSTLFFDSQTEDISVHGMFVQIRSNQLPIASPVTVMFKEGVLQLFVLEGKVAWVRPESTGADEPAGLGIEFNDMSDSRRRELEEALDQLSETPQDP